MIFSHTDNEDAPTSVLVAWSLSLERLIKTTLNPFFAKPMAKAFPIPSVHPVTTASPEREGREKKPNEMDIF
jgi:hypothetical protein